ncbi:MAG: quinone-dependent dihydroorotate dehydrogenase [Bauldia sp.]|nr:MAG: quinone-dependent dihydroorotate dehydrogenase [Bauldia sp.]
MRVPYGLMRPFLFALDPEQAHRLAINALAGGFRAPPPAPDPRLRQTMLGLDFANPLGMAAGFDKNAEVPDGLLSLGFGFVEVGTVTPLAQKGNPPPRMFRLPADGALINRLGFNNEGHDAVHRRLAARRGKAGIVGVNVGANRDSADRVGDYVSGVARFADVADYIAVNVSAPNTPGLRDLQEKKALTQLLLRAVSVRDAAAKGGRRVPLLLKVAPDLDDAALAAITDAALSVGIEGMIVANTTIARDGLTDRRLAAEAGGLSGRPLFRPSTVMLARVRKRVDPGFVLIGVGGVDSAETAFAKIAAGANLVQLYTGLVYRGPGLPADIVAGLAGLLDRHGFRTIAEATASEVDRWAAG